MTLLSASSQPSRRVLLAIGLVCFANLLLEVTLTRIFSAMMYYHFTFLAISLALLGLGASGVYVYIRADRFSPEGLEDALARNARRFAGASLLTLVYVVANPVAGTQHAGDVPLTNSVLLRLVLLIGVTVLPFFFAGVVVSLSVSAYRLSINAVYAYDLFGAACAVAVVGLALKAVGGPSVVVLVAVTASVAAALFSGRGGTRWLPAVGSVLVLIASCATPLFALPPLKSEAGRLLFEAWNAFSRVTVMALRPGVLEIQIDAAAATRITSLKSAPESGQKLAALAFQMHQGGPPEVLVIGPGGGLDVANALRAGAGRVTAVDINPIITDTIMRGRFAAESDGLYFDPRVNVVVSEGRSFVRRSGARYDVIQASLVDTWAATSAGAFALSENSLYTVEAFQDYYDHLSRDGVVAMCRYYTGHKDPETVRLLVLAAAALERRGIPPGQTRSHLYLAARRNMGLVMAKALPFTSRELDRLDGVCRDSGFEVVLSPRSADSELQRLVDSGSGSEAVRAYPLDISPPTDDRPFFFYFARLRDVLEAPRRLEKPTLMNPALWVLGAISLSVTAMAVVFVFVPLAVYRLSALRGGGRAAHARRSLGLGYFALIGLGFMTVEIALLQKLVLFLGHPTYSFVVVVSAMLVGSGSGALLAGRWAPAGEGNRLGRLVAIASGTTVLGVIAAAVVSDALRAAIAWPLGVRVAVVFLATGALGLVMGMMLPTGVRIISVRDPQIVPWAWGINGGTSVIATVGATIAAIHLGFTATLLGGAALYVLAGACGLWLTRLVTAAGADGVA